MQTSSTQNFDSYEPEYESAKHWDYLGSIHQLYMYMMYCYRDYMLSLNHTGNIPLTYHKWKVSVETYRLMIKVDFDRWISDEDNEYHVYSDKYDKIVLMSESEDVYKMMLGLIHYSQSDGLFQLTKEKQDPKLWFI